MVLGSTQPLTEISTRNISWGLRVDNLAICECDFLKMLGASPSWSPRARSGCVVFVVTVYTVNSALHSLLARHHCTTHLCTELLARSANNITTTCNLTFDTRGATWY